ncbi:MAG: arginine repressor [Bacteroidaceae bacterium]|nr:arginine repressor [Bacteroidaceae bacterium]
MKNKQNRLNAIKFIVANERIGSQEELLKRLYAQGFDLTQATLSRDLKQLKVAKTAASDGSYIYILPSSPLYKRIIKGKQVREEQVRSGFVSISFSANIAVIKTRPGYAGGIAYDIDEHDLPPVLATVAGDDTILLVIKENYTHQAVKQHLETIIPEMKIM